MSRGKRHIPQRTCITCRRKRDKRELIRLVLNDEGVAVHGERGRGKGRGAYVCALQACLEGLKNGSRIARAFRVKGSVRVSPDRCFLARSGVDFRDPMNT